MKPKQSSKTYLFIQLFIALVFSITFLSACAGMHGSHNHNNSDGYHNSNSTNKKCFSDIACGVGYKCSAGVCTGGIAPKIKGDCVRGNFGKKVCSNTGKECNNSSQCW